MDPATIMVASNNPSEGLKEVACSLIKNSPAFWRDYGIEDNVFGGYGIHTGF
jgi:hypothetical protein